MSPNEKSKIRSFLMNLALALLWTLFLYNHLLSFFLYHKITVAVFAAGETAVIIFVLLRDRATATSQDPFDWAAAFVGTCLPLLYQPTSGTEPAIASLLVIVGGIMQLCGLLSLNASFAIVPALRSIKRKFLYRVVRHPIYAAYAIGYLGYIIGNPSLWNLLILASASIFNIIRLTQEEKFLSQNEPYQKYQKEVRWRLLPFVF